MLVTYKVISMEEAQKAKLPGAEVDCEYDYGNWGIWRYEDGTVVEYIGRDGGEPEDQSLIRDWSWVVPALKGAYELGRSTVEGDLVELFTEAPCIVENPWGSNWDGPCGGSHREGGCIHVPCAVAALVK